MKTLVASLLCLQLQGQIVSLATNGDGTKLWFESSYNLKSEPEDVPRPAFRIYGYRQDEPEILASGFLTRPFLSADGLTTGWRTYIPCGPSCFLAFPRNGLQLTRNGKSISYTDRNTLDLSRNGRWLYESGQTNLLASSLTDLDSGQVTPGKDLVTIHTRHAVTDSGTVIGVDPAVRGFPGPATEVKLWTPGSEPRVIYRGDKANSAGISSDGKVAFIATQANTLVRVDPSNGDQQTVFSASLPISFSMNSDGSRVAIAIGRQVLLLGSQPIYTANEPIQQIEMTDDGSQIFVLTNNNRLVRVRVDTGETQELYPPMVGNVGQSSLGAIPGSAIRFFGSDFTDKLTFSSGGVTFPIAKITPSEFQVQVPWDFPTDESNRNFRISSPDSPLESRGALFIEKTTHPYILTVPFFPLALAAQQDFSATITQDNPAPAGSTIHLWMTGLGPLDRPLKTGEVGPVNPPARPIVPFACYLSQDSLVVGLKLPFVAYAPGLLGLYQVDATIPENWPAGKSTISCTTENRLYGTAETWTK